MTEGDLEVTILKAPSRSFLLQQPAIMYKSIIQSESSIHVIAAQIKDTSVLESHDLTSSAQVLI